MSAQPDRPRRATSWIVIGVVATLAVVVTLLTINLLANPVTQGPSATESIVASPTSEPATPLASLPATATPEQPKAAGWTVTGSMIEARSDHTATLLSDGKVLVAGGGGTSGVLASAELYDPSSGSWTTTGNMIEGRMLHTATLLSNGKVLVAGGRGDIGVITGGGGVGVISGSLESAELYDPDSGTWTATGNMIEARGYHTATLLPDGKVLVAGGSASDPSGFDSLASAELYDPHSGDWTAAGSMAEIRFAHTATLLRAGDVLVAGGFGSGGALTSADLYDPDSGTWTATGNMEAGRAKYTATLLSDGRVLAVGLGPLASAELYDPSGGFWTATENMVADHVIHTATLLHDGRVLVAGGGSRGDNPELLAFAELYDPDSGSWIATGNMVNPRDGHSATLLRDGRVLVAGGENHTGPDPRLAFAELYYPGVGP